VLEEIKDQPDALYELGRICFTKGEYQDACNYFERALKGLTKVSEEQRPNFEGPWARDLGVAYQRLGKESAAVAVFYRSQLLRPDVSIGKFLNTYWTKTAGVKLKEAIALHKAGKEKDAQKIYEEILKKDPSNGEALHFMGCILLNRKEFQQSEELLRRAIKLNPASAVYHRNLAALYVRTKRPDEALRLWRHALTLDTIDEAGINEVANALVEHGAYQDAVAAYKKALEKNPNSARTMSNLGRAYTLVKSDDDAKGYLTQAMALDDKLLDPPLILARIAVDQGNYEEARTFLAVTKKLSPRHPYVVWSEAFIGLGIYYDSQAQSDAQMADFVDRMKVLEKYLSKANMSEIENGVGYRQPYEIAYFDQNNKRWLAAYGRAICTGLKRWQKEHNIPVPKARVIDGPIRVGIVMGFFFNHSVWNALVKGWMMASPKQDIEFHAFYTRPIVDKETERAKGYATAFHSAPKVLKDWAQTISDSKCDVLIYPEIGMEPVTLKLAAMRLAPVQVGSWGHAEGTGLPTIDYYLTGDLIEPANAQDNYSEKIVRLPNLGCYVEPWAVTPEEINPQEFGLDAARPWLVCPGSPYKYRPEHDQLWLNVAKRLPNAQLLFFLHTRRQGTSNRIRGRLERLFEQEGMDLNNHAVFVPWLTANRFFGIMKRSTVFLDTIGFSGFNTAQQGIECGLPIVTIEGKYMRGMLASGLLRRIGATDTIVSNQEEYIECASRLVEDPQFAESVRAKMASGIQAIYRDQSAMDGFVEFIKSVTNYQKGGSTKTLVSRSKAKDKVDDYLKPVTQGEVKGRVTIAIPAYNLQFFEKALASAQQQDYSNIEILVSDDSPDNRIQEITVKRGLTDSRIRHIKNDKNLGFFGNFTQCYKLASGEYIKYLNDDDMLLTGCISRMVKAMEIDEKIKLVFSKRNHINQDGELINYNGPQIKTNNDTLIDGIELGNLILENSLNLIGEPTTAMFKKKDITLENDNIFYWEGVEYHCFADVSLWLRLLAKGKAYYINEALSNYRRHEGQEQRKPEVSIKCLTERFYILKPSRLNGFISTREKYTNSINKFLEIISKSNSNTLEILRIKKIIESGKYENYNNNASI
jgi:predicted O-linked N-acetylglucosamine transferase (SPINDLY family)/glycosyltransferase involved in cell wall biosynthesis